MVDINIREQDVESLVEEILWEYSNWCKDRNVSGLSFSVFQHWVDTRGYVARRIIGDTEKFWSKYVIIRTHQRGRRK